MGYSCTARAAYTMDALMNKFRHENSGNTYTVDGGKTQYFHERGREQADGAMTGTCWLMLPDGHCRKAGTYRIEADGKITRFCGIVKRHWPEIEAASAKRYDEVFTAHS